MYRPTPKYTKAMNIEAYFKAEPVLVRVGLTGL
jgi:hypothetical protein